VSRVSPAPAIDEYINDLLDAAADEGIELRVVSKLRSQQQQDALYAQGRTTEGPIVTWTTRSAHTSGRAVDVTIVGATEYEDDPEAWDALGRIGEELGLKWGGSFRDYGHFEV